jgi:DNA-binding transcriptional regulator GbsR (MarR family)
MASELMPKRIFDENAQSILEITRATGMARTTVNDYVRKLMQQGKMERVWKRGSRHPVPAYRIVANR